MDESYAFEGENFNVRILTQSVRSEMQQFEVIERPKIVMALPMSLDGSSIFFVKQKRVAMDKLTIEFPAGRIDEGEQAESAIRRELLEEIGFSTSILKYIGDIATAPHFCDENIKLFFAKGSIVQDPQPSSRESSLCVVSVESGSLLSMIKNGCLIDAKSLAAFSIAIANRYIVL